MQNVESSVVAPAPSHDLTTLRSVRLDFDIQDDADDVYLQSLITAVSGSIESYCSRIFALQGYADTFAHHRHNPMGFFPGSIRHRQSLFLRNRPVVTGSVSVEVDGQSVTSFRVIPDIGVVHLHGFAASYAHEIVVTYQAGWVLPGWAAEVSSGIDAPALPAPVETAAKEFMLTRREAGRLAYATAHDPTIRTETTEGVGSVSYWDTNARYSAIDIPAAVELLLAPYLIPVGG